jgi:chromosome segregation ATPase
MVDESVDEKCPRPKHLQSNGANANVNIQDHEQKPEGKINTLELKEAEQKIASLETANKALTGDKVSLQESIDSLNKEKIALQESVTGLKKELEESKLGVAHEKELREAAESKIEEMSKEVKVSLVESLTALREKAGKPALEKLEERSIDSLRDSISDLKAELKESEQKAADDKNADNMKDAKGAAQNVSLQESEQKLGDNDKADAAGTTAAEDFSL